MRLNLIGLASDTHHLDKDFLSVLQALEQRWVLNLKLLLVTLLEGALLNLPLRVNKRDNSRSARQHKLRLITENHLDDFVAVPEEDGLLSTLPFLNVRKIRKISGSLWQIILVKVERHGSELAVSLKVRLEMLQQNDLLSDGVRVLKEVVLIYLFDGVGSGVVTHTLNVDKVEQI